ncbi:MAG: RecB-like helicase [Campylobacter sp.]|nr:RecB-like helicase [Campylobacter sp.]
MKEFKPFLALEASAGSGKTFALSVRFVALILMGAKINEILALTFTKKACNEMQKRVIETFLNFEKDERKAECEQLCKFLGKNKEELIALRDLKKQEFLRQNLKIYTFDAFFGKILRSFALNLGLMSDFKSSENELDIKAVFLKILNEAELKDLAHYILDIDEKENFFKELENLYQNAYFKEYKNPQNFPNKALINQNYEDLRSYCLTLNHKDLSKSFENEKLDLDSFLQSSFMNKFETTKYLQKFYNEDEKFREKRELFLQALNTYALELESFKIAKLMNLLEHFCEAKNQIHKEKNVLSFADISKKVLELVQSELKELIYFRLDGFIAHLLIDEFQDTSVIQYQILKPIIAELVSGVGVREFRSFFYVGDKKQSIYRFRKGKKELFDLLKHEFTQIKSDSLDTNYRSLETLVEFINTTFKDKFPNYLLQKIPNDKAKQGGFVRIVSSKEQSSDEIKEKTLETLLEQIEFLQEKNAGELCILCWKNDDCDLVLDFLKSKQILAFTQSNILLENKASVRLVLEYAKYCIFGDEFYLHFIKSLTGLNVPRLKLDLSKSAAQNVLYLIKNLKLDLSESALIQFLEYAQSKENFLELLFEPCPLKIMSEQNLGISIMSVHKSKGLEFENVILLDSLSKPSPNFSNILLEYDIYEGWELKIRDKIRKNEPNYMKFLEKIQKAELDDDINKLYVAMTRAKKALIIIKRNETCINGHYPSYFNSNLYLKLKDAEFGELEKEEKKVQNQSFQSKKNLPNFVKVGLQELGVQKSFDTKQSYFGEAFHYFMQNINLKTKANFEKICENLKNKFRFLEEEELKDIFSRVESLLNNENFNGLLQGKRLLKEQSFSFEGQIKRLDLLALDENENFIIDYKTGKSAMDEHKNQIEFYKLGVSEILKKRTKAFIVYCLKNETQIIEI